MKEIKFSRHAKRRMKLYNISEDVIVDILQDVESMARQEIVKDISDFDYLIKVVFNALEDYIIVITAYPLKRGLL